MKLYDKNTGKNTIIFMIVGFLMVPLIVWAIDTVATGFRATSTEKKIDIVAASQAGHTANECYYVRSTTSSDYFVPTKTAAEWAAFKSGHGSVMEKWVCGVPENNCRVGYDYRIDGDDAPIRYTGYTNNTTTYQGGSYSIDHRNDDRHCNGSIGCGLRASVECLNDDYAIRVGYQFDLDNTQSTLTYTPWSDSSSAFGAFSTLTTSGEAECDDGCGIRMFIETRGDDALVSCSIGYRHRNDGAESVYAYDGAWSTFTNNSSDDEDCENAGCGMQVRLYCDGPGAGNGGVPVPPAGQCGSADGGIYSGAPPSSLLCSSGTANGLENLGSFWGWSCETSGGGDYCFSTDTSGGGSSSSGGPLN